MHKIEQRVERLAALSGGDFDAHVGQEFLLSTEEQQLHVQLVRVQTLSPVPPAAHGRRPFSLWFRGPPRPCLPQGTYCVDHQLMGKMAMFLVPIGVDAEGMRYEAIFA